MEVTVRIPAQKTDDALAKRLDTAFARIEQALTKRTSMAPTMDAGPMVKCLQRMETQQGKMLGVLKELRSGLRESDSLDELRDVLEAQWKKLQRSLQGFAEPEVRLPGRFYSALDQLEDALTQPHTMRMPPAMGKKFDELKEAIQRSRPKTFGMMR